MKIRTVLLSLVLLSLLAVTLPGAALAQEPPPDRNVLPFSPATFLSNGYDTTAAYGGGWYAVANTENGKLKVNFFKDLTLVETYTIADEKSYNPDIAYEASSGLFVLVWEHLFGTAPLDVDVYAIALDPENGADPPVEGSQKILAGSGAIEGHPSVDCNPDAGSCLFVWDYSNEADTRRIDGRFVEVSTDQGLDSFSTLFTISTLNLSQLPSVAFGGSSYLVTYTWFDGTFWPVFSHVHPTFQPVGFQYMHSTERLIKTNELNVGNHKYSESVAYDSCAGVFVATILYDFSGDGSDYAILARPVHPTSATVYNYFWIANAENSEYGASLSFIEGYDQAGFPPKGAKFVLSYTRNTGLNYPAGILTTDLLSNCSSTSPRYRVVHFAKHTLVAVPDPSFGSEVYHPAVAGGGGFQQFLVAWVNYRGSDGKHQTMGMLMDATEKNYLPLVVK